MSRCFPYPLPPEYCDDDDLAAATFELDLGDDSKKINKSDRKKNKERRKEQKREKKARREKEKNDKDGQSCEFKSKKHSHKKRRKDDGDHLKTREDELEQLEKSSLTEECGQPTSTQALYDSSDSTQNSNKRKKQAASSIASSHKLGSILRIRTIRLPLLKHYAPEVPQQKEQECSISGRLVIHGPKVSNSTPRQVSDTTPRSGCTSGRNAITPAGNTFLKTPAEEKATPIADSTRFLVSGPPKIFTEYRDLVENWIPPLIQRELDLDDQDWLFDSNKRQPQQHIAKRGDYDALTRKSSSLWPSACYLAAADIYALPYTVQF